MIIRDVNTGIDVQVTPVTGGRVIIIIGDLQAVVSMEDIAEALGFDESNDE